MSCAGITPVRDLAYSDDGMRDRMWRWGVGEMTRTADAVGSPVFEGLGLLLPFRLLSRSQTQRRTHCVSCAGITPVRDLAYSDDGMRDRVWRWGVGEMTRTADAVGSPVSGGLVAVAVSIVTITNTTASPQRELCG